jgi:ferredoxin-NADP reductase
MRRREEAPMTFKKSEARSLPLLVSLLAALVLAAPLTSSAQMTPEEHASHHPGAAGAGGAPAQAGGMGGMMAGMGEMMKGMGAPPQKDFYPSLMDFPQASEEKAAEIRRKADERMTSGVKLVGDGLESFSSSTSQGDFAAAQAALGAMHEGLSQTESAISAYRALAEGTPPRSVALAWFKGEMGLEHSPAEPHRRGPFGLSWFHFSVMAVLSGFAASMLWMYFHKMNRAARLLQELTGGASSTALGASASATSTINVVPAAAPAVPRADDTASPAPGGKWSGRLRVARIFEETPDVKTFRLMNPLGGVLPFTFLPGQFLTVTVPADGKPVRRSYTIASSPTQHDYAELTVKHEPGGVVSGYLNDKLKEGDLLDCSGPSGAFVFTGRECKCILLIGGGVGVTPMMSVIRYLTDRAWPGDIYLLYGVHAPEDIIFREELAYLQRRNPNVRVVITVSHPEGTDWGGPKGRLGKELIAQSVPDLASRYVHLCGPVSLMETVKKALLELGVPVGRIKTEAFGPALGKPEPVPSGAQSLSAGKAAELPTVTFTRSEKAGSLSPDKAILDVADELGVEIDNSCRVGTCGLCRVKLLSGKVTMAVEDGLEPGDREKNIILACQAKATGDVSVEA